MKSMLLKLLFSLLSSLLGLLGESIIAFIDNYRAARMDNVEFTEAVKFLVDKVAIEHPEWNGAKKREYVVGEAKIWLNAAGLDLKESLIRTTTELAVQALDATRA